MPNDEGWLQTVVYFMQFMCVALSFTNKKKNLFFLLKKKKNNEDTSIGLCSVREIIVYTHEIFFAQNHAGQMVSSVRE